MKMGYRVKPSRLLTGLAPASRQGKTRPKGHVGLPDDGQSIEDKVERLFSGKDLLFERLDAEPKLSVAMQKSLNSIRQSSKVAARYVHKQPMLAKVAVITILALGVGGLSYISRSPNDNKQLVGGTPSVSEVAGVTTSTENTSGIGEGINTNKPSFSIVTPGGERDVSGYERKAPSGVQLYSYLDTIGERSLEVTQQPLPAVFKSDQDTKLSELAIANYLNKQIQVDKSTVYHGLNEASGRQSVMFIVADSLIFIEADGVIDDDQLVAYILNLQ